MNVILDAEMVAFSNRLNKVDGAYSGVVSRCLQAQPSLFPEFWRIRSLVTGTARGARGGMFGAQPESHEEP
jgi:hypothetical protein